MAIGTALHRRAGQGGGGEIGRNSWKEDWAQEGE